MLRTCVTGLERHPDRGELAAPCKATCQLRARQDLACDSLRRDENLGVDPQEPDKRELYVSSIEGFHFTAH